MKTKTLFAAALIVLTFSTTPAQASDNSKQRPPFEQTDGSSWFDSMLDFFGL